MNYDDVPEWAVQVACEYLGLEGLWNVDPRDYPEVMNLAMQFSEKER
jgi:hypothetical protein